MDGGIMKKVKNFVLVLFGILIFISLAVETGRPMPGNAFVVVDREAMTYFAPHYFQEQQVELPANLDLMDVQDAREMGYTLDLHCRDLGYFTEKRVSLLRGLLEQVGVIPERKHRWNPDGTWNW
jgi:hypothetical protein